MLKYKAGYQAYLIDRLIFRAVQYANWLKARGEAPELIKVMQAGLRVDANPLRSKWLLRASIAEETDRGYVQAWIDECVYGKKKAKKEVREFVKREDKIPESIADILKSLIKGVI
jgi:hypothetical protein